MTLVHVEIIPKPNGHLLCEECGTYWCLHIENMVKQGTDEQFIWDEWPDPLQLEIPIVPTANLWARVLLEKPEAAKTQMYQVSYYPDVTVSESMGYIFPSEGRNVMRSMILDWFTGTQEQDIKECTSSGHGYKQTMKFIKDSQSPGTKIVQLWSIWATGKCLGCTFDLKNNPDLVPDVSTKSPWS